MLAHAAPHPRSGAIPGIINFNRLRSAGAGIIGKNERRPVQKGAAVKIRLTGLRAGTRPAGGELAVLQAASPPNNPLGLCLAGRPDFLLTVLRTPGNPKFKVRRPSRPARDIPICHLRVSGFVHRPRRGALYEPGTSYVRATYEVAPGLIEILLSLVLPRTWLGTGSCRARLTRRRVCRMFRSGGGVKPAKVPAPQWVRPVLELARRVI